MRIAESSSASRLCSPSGTISRSPALPCQDSLPARRRTQPRSTNTVASPGFWCSLSCVPALNAITGWGKTFSCPPNAVSAARPLGAATAAASCCRARASSDIFCMGPPYSEPGPLPRVLRPGPATIPATDTGHPNATALVRHVESAELPRRGRDRFFDVLHPAGRLRRAQPAPQFQHHGLRPLGHDAHGAVGVVPDRAAEPQFLGLPDGPVAEADRLDHTGHPRVQPHGLAGIRRKLHRMFASHVPNVAPIRAPGFVAQVWYCRPSLIRQTPRDLCLFPGAAVRERLAYGTGANCRRPGNSTKKCSYPPPAVTTARQGQDKWLDSSKSS